MCFFLLSVSTQLVNWNELEESRALWRLLECHIDFYREFYLCGGTLLGSFTVLGEDYYYSFQRVKGTFSCLWETAPIGQVEPGCAGWVQLRLRAAQKTPDLLSSLSCARMVPSAVHKVSP